MDAMDAYKNQAIGQQAIISFVISTLIGLLVLIVVIYLGK